MNETLSIIRELFVDDVYHADRVFDRGDKWLDVGCHQGLFSSLACAHYADVVGAVDSDRDTLDLYEHSVKSVPTFHQRIETWQDMCDLVEVTQPTAVKMDIQGSEQFLIERDGFAFLDDAQITKLLLEWHDVEAIDLIVKALMAFLQVEFIDRATDILTSDDTYVIYATRSLK